MFLSRGRTLALAVCVCTAYVCMFVWELSGASTFFLQCVGLSTKGVLLRDVNSSAVLRFALSAVISSRAAKCNWAKRPLKCAVIGRAQRLF